MKRGVSCLAFATALCLYLATTANGADVKEGQKAPNIELPATQIETILPEKKGAKTLSLSDLKGKKNVVLFFFPKAMTPGCTVECQTFRDHAKQFAQHDTVLIGISTDTLALQEKFTQRDKLNFPLFADAEKKASEAFGVLAGKAFAQRWTFVIDKEGTVRKIYTKVVPKQHADEVLEYVKQNLKK